MTGNAAARLWGRVLTVAAAASIGLALLAGTAGGQDFGLGFIIGRPTGLSLKVWSSSRTAVDAGFAWREDLLSVHADILFHSFRGAPVRGSRFGLYYGLGFRSVDNARRLGVRVPLGLTFLLDKLPLDLFLEVVPAMDVRPRTEFGLLLAGGFRIYLL